MIVYREDVLRDVDAAIDNVDHVPQWFIDIINETIKNVPSALSCQGCKHQGQWENEYEMGYPSPCTRCMRRSKDNYEK